MEWMPSPEEKKEAPNIDFICQLGKFALRPWNSALFTFRAENNMSDYNHIFHWKEEGDHWPQPEQEFLYIPEKYIIKPEYEQLYKMMSDYMIENGYPLHLNGLNVPSTDKKVVESLIIGDLKESDYIPEDWENEM